MRPSIVFAVAAALALSAVTAEAKKKKIVSNGCTMEQLQSSRASACIDKAEKDLKNGSRYTHMVFCGAEFGSTGMACCKTGDSRTFACEPIRVAQPPSDHTPVTGGVLEPGPKQRPPHMTIPGSGGILEQGPSLGTSGPSATGTPVGGSAPPAPRPHIIR